LRKSWGSKCYTYDMIVEVIAFFVALHTLGAIIGTGYTTYAEIFYTRAAADDRIDHHERKYLRHLFRGLKFGMVLVLISGVVLIVLEYLVPNAPEDVLASPFWALQTFTYLIIALAWMLSKKKMSWWFSSAAILVGWWMILLIDFGVLNAYNYIQILLAYIFVSFIVAGLLGYVRVWMRRHQHHHT
jgi:hypothetical protein